MASSSSSSNHDDSHRVSAEDLDIERAETDLVERLEARPRTASNVNRDFLRMYADQMPAPPPPAPTSSPVLSSSQAGRPPMVRQRQRSTGSASGSSDRIDRPPSFKAIAQRVRLMQLAASGVGDVSAARPSLGARGESSRLLAAHRGDSSRQLVGSGGEGGRRTHHHHRKTTSVAHDVLQAIQNSEQDHKMDLGRVFQADGLFDDPSTPLFGNKSGELGDNESSSSSLDHSDTDTSRSSPDQGSTEMATIEEEDADAAEPLLGLPTLNYQSTDDSDDPRPRRTTRRRRPPRKQSLAEKLSAWCHPKTLLENFVSGFIHSTLPVAFCCFGTAAILYYWLGNPMLEFLPGHATLGWWFNFIGRQLLMLELARVSQRIIVDGLLSYQIGRLLTVQVFGSYVTFFAYQSKGWPFLLAAWGVWDLLLLHGSGAFQAHWLYWTGWRIYSEANSGTYIITSELYLRVLLSMIVAGSCTAAKRTILALRFGRRQLAEFKPLLERILKDVVIVSEVAVLADEIDALHGTESLLDINAVDWQHATKEFIHESVSWQLDSDRALDRGRSCDEDDEETFDPSSSPHSPPGSSRRLSKTMSGSIRLKELLDRWEEPINRSDKSSRATIQDMLKFRRVLQFLDETHPFGEAFGPASDRNECIDSSHSVYWRLIKLTPGSNALPFETLSLTAVIDDDGTTDEGKLKSLRRVFRPDVSNELPKLAFIQSVDAVYKRLRYFRASVGNASVTDMHLESILNGIFFFILGLSLLTFLNFNPWPLMVSISSVLVSISFALGSSVSKYVEGLLLIAVRRPYDLGDRVFISSAEIAENKGAMMSWFVEDINLFTTTLRFASTNEVSTVNNWSISASRIVNCNRSPRAIVLFSQLIHMCVFDGDKVKEFRSALEHYIRDRPRIWDSMPVFRHDEIDADREMVTFSIGFQHRQTWQDAGRILIDRAELLRFVHETARTQGIAYSSPAQRPVVYHGGVLEKGQVTDYKANLLRPENIRNYKEDGSLSKADPSSALDSLAESERTIMPTLSQSGGRDSRPFGLHPRPTLGGHR